MISDSRSCFILDIYLDKENKVVFIALNHKFEDEVLDNILNRWKESETPYQVIVFDNINKFEVI